MIDRDVYMGGITDNTSGFILVVLTVMTFAFYVFVTEFWC